MQTNDRLITELMTAINNGRIQLPDFQRGWVWEDGRIKALIASITNNYPVGAAMFLEYGNENVRFKYRTIEGAEDAGDAVPTELILDGQQRLTSIYSSLYSKQPVHTRTDKGKEIYRYYYIDIQKAMDESYDRLDAIFSVPENKIVTSEFGRKEEINLSKQEYEFENKVFPLNRILDYASAQEWQNEYYAYYGYNQDIIKQLSLRNPKIFISSFDRPNLSLEVKRGYQQKDKTRTILEFIARHKNECGIIYCMSRSKTENVAEMLRKHGIRVAVYHAGLSATARDEALNDFINDRVQVVCATIAFGMGIDKSNVRWVIHYNLPKSIESFYQEIGRAGRDGMESDTLLFYSLSDLILLSKFATESNQQEINLEKLNHMQQYTKADIFCRSILLN